MFLAARRDALLSWKTFALRRARRCGCGLPDHPPWFWWNWIQLQRRRV